MTIEELDRFMDRRDSLMRDAGKAAEKTLDSITTSPGLSVADGYRSFAINGLKEFAPVVKEHEEFLSEVFKKK